MKHASALVYTRHRDLHAVGIVLLQMLLGPDVTERFTDAHAALQACESPPPPSLPFLER